MKCAYCDKDAIWVSFNNDNLYLCEDHAVKMSEILHPAPPTPPVPPKDSEGTSEGGHHPWPGPWPWWGSEGIR